MSRKRSRARTVLRIVLAVIGTIVVFVVAVVAGAVLHLDAPPARRLVAARVSALLHGLFAGDFVIEHIGHLGLRGVDGARVRVKDPEGRQVIYADGVRARVHSFAIVRSLLAGKGDILVPIDLASIGGGEVSFDVDATGKPRIARTFEPRTPSPPSPKNPAARGVRLDLPFIRLSHGWVHAGIPGAPAIDAGVADLAGSLHFDPKGLRVQLEGAELRARGLPRSIDPQGHVAGHFVMPSASGRDFGADGTFDGLVAGVPTAAHAKMDGLRLDAVVDGHDATGQGMRSTFGEVGINKAVTVHAEAHGELPAFEAKANVTIGRGTAAVVGHVDLGDGVKVDAQIGARHVDLRAIVPSAPSSDVGLDARGHLDIPKVGDPSASGTVDTLAGSIEGEPLPTLHARGELDHGVGRATGAIADARGTVNVDVKARRVGAESVVEAEVHADVLDLGGLPKIGGTSLAGHALVDASGSVSLGSAKTLDARAHVVGEGLAYGAQSLREATLVATAHGTVDHPVVEVGIHAAAVAAGAQKLDVADVRTRIEPGAVTTFVDPHVDVVRDGVTASASADRVHVTSKRILVERGIVAGLGAPIHADLSRNADEIRLQIDAPAVDLRRVAIVAGRGAKVRAGNLSIGGDVVIRRDGVTGTLRAKVDSLSAGKIDGGAASLDTAFDGKHLGLALDVELADVARLSLVTKGIQLDGSPLALASWRRAHGQAKFDGKAEMAKLAELVPDSMMPFGELEGLCRVAGAIRRDSADVPPELSLHVDTRGLVVAGRGKPEESRGGADEVRVKGVEPWRSEDVDVSLDARVDATSGFAEIGLHAFDPKGTVAAFDLKADLPYQEALSEPSRARELLVQAPISARFVVPKRAFAAMPKLAGVHTMPGTVEAEVDVVGTARQPHVDVVAHGRGVRAPTLADELATDVDVSFTYDGEKGDLVAAATTEKHRALDLTAHVDLRSEELLERRHPPAWTGSAKMKLDGFHVETLAPFSDRRVRGRVSGVASIDELHRDAKAHVQLSVEQLKVGRASYERGVVVAALGAGKADAKVRLEQTDGYLDASAKTELAWGAALAPTIDRNANIEARLEAKGFRAAALQPFVRGVFNEIDGRIDAHATARVSPGMKEAAFDGSAVLHDGTLQIVSFAEEFKDARAKVTFKPGGVIAVDDIYMRSSEGELTANGIVKMRGLALGSLAASAHIPKRKELDVSVQGQPIGAVSGDVVAEATTSQDGKHLTAKVDVKKMDLGLLQKRKSGVQDLGRMEGIRVGTFRDPKTFVRLPLDGDDLAPSGESEPEPGMIIDADIVLGDVTIVQPNQARIVVGGTPHVRLGSKTQLSGQVQVKHGKIEVQGKEFEIEKGTVTFQPEDSSNPVIVATAAWTAEDGSKVYADFTGPLKTGKVNLRSDPARPKNEILAMILFGTADGANAAPPPPGRAPNGTTKAATTLGGGFAAQGLTEALDDLTGIQATARIDTTRSANPAPEIEVQLARRVSIAFEHILGTPPLSEPDTNLAIVNLRFRGNWSLATTVGDRGKVQTDAVWTKRY